MILPQINQRLQQTEAFFPSQHKLNNAFTIYCSLLKQEIGQPVKQGTRLSVRLTHQDLDACSTTRLQSHACLANYRNKYYYRLNHHIILTEQGLGCWGPSKRGGEGQVRKT